MANYVVSKVPIRLYYDSYRANNRDTSLSGWLYETGSYEIVNQAWDVGTNAPTQTRPSSGVALYGIARNGSVIGWVRDDENLSPSSVKSIQATTIKNSFTVYLQGDDSSARHELKFSVDGETIKTTSFVGLQQTLQFTTAERQRLMQLLPANGLLTIRVEVKTFINTQLIGEVTAYNWSIGLEGELSPVVELRWNNTGIVNGTFYTEKSSIQADNILISVAEDTTIKEVLFLVNDTIVDRRTYSAYMSYTFPSPTSAGNYTFKVTAVDRKGREATRQITKYYAEGIPASISNLSAKRQETVADITANGHFGTIGSRSGEYFIYTKETGTTSWRMQLSGNVTVVGAGWTITRVLPNLDKDKAYDLRLSVYIQGNPVLISEISIGLDDIPLSMGRYGVGIGTLVDDDGAMIQVGEKGIYSAGRIEAQGGIISRGPSTFDALAMFPKYLQVGTGAGVTFVADTSRPIGLQMDDNDIKYNGVSLMGGGQVTNPLSDVYAHTNSSYGRFTVNNLIVVKYGRASVSGSEYTVTFNANGNKFAIPPFVMISAVSGRWEFAMPSLTSVTTTGFTASSVNAANGEAISGSHEINYIAIGVKA